jgi:hypothetical protein
MIAGDGVADGQREEAETGSQQNDVEHGLLPFKCLERAFEIEAAR